MFGLDALEVFDKGIGHVRSVIVSDARGGTLDIFHQAIQIIARIGDAYHAESGAIPQSAGLELGHRNVEAGTQTVFQAANHLPFVLERLRGFDVKFEGEEGDQGQFPVSSFWKPS